MDKAENHIFTVFSSLPLFTYQLVPSNHVAVVSFKILLLSVSCQFAEDLFLRMFVFCLF